MEKTYYFMVEGWIHPKRGGDDVPFIKGFYFQADKKPLPPREQMAKQVRKWLAKNGSAVTSDFVISEVSAPKWHANFSQ